MKDGKVDVLIAAVLFSLAWAASAVVFPKLRLLFVGVALLSAFLHLVMLGFMRTDDIDPQYTTRDYVRDHAYSLRASALLFLVIAGVFGLFGLGRA